MPLLSLLGCMSMDSFFFNPLAVDSYALDSDVVPAENFEVVPFDSGGFEIYGLWAHQDDPGGAPLLLYFHGNSENLDAYIDQIGRYWSWGYEVFSFDYRGFGMSEGTPTYDGVMEDGVAAVTFVEATTGRAPGSYPYHGLSLGGSVAVHTAVSHPPSVLVTEAMFASGDKLIDDGAALDFPDGWLLEDEWDNAAAASDVHVPYFIVHGGADEFIQPSHAEVVYSAANDPKKLWIVDGADHTEVPDVAPDEYRENVVCWYTETCIE